MRLKRIDATGKPYRIYADYLESGAIEQFVAAMQNDTVVQGALMPDAHTGYSLPIGAVVAVDGHVYPSFVGYDIGCGMSALPVAVAREAIEANARLIFEQIYRDIPVGFNINQTPSPGTLDPQDLSEEGRAIAEAKHYLRALGSLGGGNHFIEIGVDETNQVWIIIHSGSRGVGHGIAQHYMKKASPDGKAREGHHGFRTDSAEGQAYINDLNWALQFALDNREEMIRRVVGAIVKVLGSDAPTPEKAGLWGRFINRNHNHAELKNGLWIHRKGATHAERGMMGVIPGNMRDGSFIVKGKGNPEALSSSSHGAGRVMGRRQAKERLDMKAFESAMSGITARVEQGTLDESPMAYKDIHEVMRLQADLVDVIHHVRPIINVKG